MEQLEWSQMVDLVFDIHGDTILDVTEHIITSCQQNHCIMARARPHELCQVILKCIMFGGTDVDDDGVVSDDEKGI
jgi:hypothetical protein